MNEPNELKSKLPIRKRDITDAELDQVRQSLRGLLSGSGSIVIQDGVIVQIDRTETPRSRQCRLSLATFLASLR
jgi:hypothetical protein